MVETSCENQEGQENYCDRDQLSFKNYLARWMASTARLVPSTYDTIMPVLRTSAQAAVATCSGGSSGLECGARWTTNGTNDGNLGVGQQMSALQVVGALLVQKATTLVTNNTGGTSQGNDAAGTGNSGSSSSSGGTTLNTTPTVTSAGKAGAGIITALILCGVLGGGFFMIKD